MTNEDDDSCDEIVTFESSEIWLKIVGMLQHNWAFVETQVAGVAVIFFDDLNRVFDTLAFDSRDDAEAALVRNGFARYDDDKQAQEFIAKPANPFRVSLDNRRPIYSSGEYWI